MFCCALIEGNLCTYKTNVTNGRTSYHTRFIRFLLRKNAKQANKKLSGKRTQVFTVYLSSVSVNPCGLFFVCACLCVSKHKVYTGASQWEHCLQGNLKCYVRGLCAPVGRSRLSQQSNNNCRYTMMLALAASAWEYPAQLLSITTHAPRIFDTPAKHSFSAYLPKIMT